MTSGGETSCEHLRLCKADSRVHTVYVEHAPPRTGAQYAERLGFEGPFRDPVEIRKQRQDAEQLTGKMVEEYYGVIDIEERYGFIESLKLICAEIPER